MKLDRDSGTGNVIRSFLDGQILIGTEAFAVPVILDGTHIIRDWQAPDIPDLRATDLEPALALDPEVILLGTGVHHRFIAPALAADIFRRGIGLEVMSTAAACRTFNLLVAEHRRSVAVLYTR